MPRRLCSFLLLMVVACPVQTSAQTTSSTRYRIDQFTSEEGLPGHHVYDIVQTPDGYLWVAATGPGGQTITIGPKALTLGSGSTFTRTLTQTVPGLAPAGTYTQQASAGAFSSDILASDSFTWEKADGVAKRATVLTWTTDFEAALSGGETASLLAEGQAGSSTLPADYALEQNYPNPFNPATAIHYALPEASTVQLVVYNVLGREVARLVDGAMPAGRHQVRWQAGDQPSGLYLYRLTAGAYAEVRTMVLLR